MFEEKIAKFLKKCKPGKVPTPIFYEFSRLFYTIAADLVVFDAKGNVLLTKRPKSDPFWPNRLHIPGKIMIRSDKSYDDAVQRVIKDELPGILVTKPILVGDSLPHGIRGKAENKIFIARLIKNNQYKFYNPKKLPKSTIKEVKTTLGIALSKIEELCPKQA